jgi:sulfur carrier protein ThiS
VRLTVTLHGPVRRPFAEVTRSCELAAPATVADLLSDLGFAAAEQAVLHVAVNGAAARRWSHLNDGDDVIVMLKAGGG